VNKFITPEQFFAERDALLEIIMSNDCIGIDTTKHDELLWKIVKLVTGYET